MAAAARIPQDGGRRPRCAAWEPCGARGQAMVAATAAQRAAAARGTLRQRFGRAGAAPPPVEHRRSPQPWPLSVIERNLMVTRGGAEVGRKGQEAPGQDRVRGRLVQRGVPDFTSLRPVTLPSRSTVNSRSTAPDPGGAPPGDHPVPVDLVLEPVEPDGEVRALGVEEQRSHLLPGPRNGAARGPPRAGGGRDHGDSPDNDGWTARAWHAPPRAAPAGRFGGDASVRPARAAVGDEAEAAKVQAWGRRRLGPLRAVAADGPSAAWRSGRPSAEKDRTLRPVAVGPPTLIAVGPGAASNRRRLDDGGNGHRRRRPELQDLGRRQNTDRTLRGRGGDDFPVPPGEASGCRSTRSMINVTCTNPDESPNAGAALS